MEEIRNIENRDNDYFCSFLCKENDNIDNKLPYLKLSHVVIRCRLKNNDNIDNKLLKSCFTLLFEINDNIKFPLFFLVVKYLV